MKGDKSGMKERGERDRIVPPNTSWRGRGEAVPSPSQSGASTISHKLRETKNKNK
jgi:hypothetical protein